MINVSIEKLCEKLDIGVLCSLPEQIFGGLLHTMYKVETEKGKYAIKALNPNIMKRDEALRNFIFSERVANIALNNNIPAVPAIRKDDCLHFIDDSYFMVFPWVDAKSILPEEATTFHCMKIGKILAKIHSIDFSEVAESEFNTPELNVTNWDSYCGYDTEWAKELEKIKNYLYEWEKQANYTAEKVFSNQVVSHRDMDCKNVLWNKENEPIVIDWEAAGFINPLQELVEVALAWAGIESDSFNLENFKAIINSYVESEGMIEADVSAVLSFGYTGKLEWLEYNLKRAVGIEAQDKAEIELGIKEVLKTIDALKRYERLIPICAEVVSTHVKS